jgi:hypothetical protein
MILLSKHTLLEEDFVAVRIVFAQEYNFAESATQQTKNRGRTIAQPNKSMHTHPYANNARQRN